METEEMEHFLRLPPEILETVFLSSSVGARELGSLSRTCSIFRDVLHRNEFWKLKFVQRWPDLQSHLQTCFKDGCLNWKSLYCSRFLLRKCVAKKLKELSFKTHHGQEKALLIMEEGNFYNFDDLPAFSEVCFDFEQRTPLIINELLEVYHAGDKNDNLNAKLFAGKSLNYLRHLQLESDIKTYASRSAEEKDVEEGVVLIAEWFQPTKTFSLADIKHELDRLASDVRTLLSDMHPNHPCFTFGCSIPDPSELKESLWKPHDCRLILSAIEQTLKPLLQTDISLKEYFSVENSFINLVLQLYKGIPITLSLLVLLIARRLGLVLQPVNFPRHFILRWMEHPTRCGIDRYTFVDVFNGNYCMTFSDLVENFTVVSAAPISVQNCDSCTTDEVLQRMLRNLVALGRQGHQGEDMLLLHNACQLYILFFPQDLHMNLLEIQIQLYLGINLPKALCVLEELASAIPWMHARLSQLQNRCQHDIEKVKQSEKCPEPKRRSIFPEVKFSVGMVMRHKKYDYLCVIYGWDENCKATRDWILQMGVNERQVQEPFYNVLVMDGSYRYACQENLLFTQDTCVITHPMVGLYFESFDGRYYTLCDSMQEQYPDDSQVTQDSVTEFFNSQDQPHE